MGAAAVVVVSGYCGRFMYILVVAVGVAAVDVVVVVSGSYGRFM